MITFGYVNAQVSTSYTFSTSNTAPYTYITGGTVYGGPNDDDFYYNAPIGFNFSYNGVSFSNLWVDANGFITFGGPSTPPSSTYYYGPPVAYNSNCIAAFAQDLQGDSLPTSEMRIQTIGTAPNRTCIIQWRDWGLYGASGISAPSTAEIYNFQIQLFENNGNGIVQIVYGGFHSTTLSTAITVQAGLSGTTTSDFNDRTATTTWLTTTAGTANTSSISYSNTIKPDSGRTFTWVIPPAPMVWDSVTTVQVTNGVLQNSTNNPVVAAVVYTHGSANPKVVTQVNFNTIGTNNLSDISNAKVFFTGTNAVFTATNQFGSTVAVPSGAMTFNGYDTLSPGANYFWLTYNVASGAALGDSLDGQCTNVTDSLIHTHTPIVTSPAGFRKIILPLTGTYTINPSAIASSTNFVSFTTALASLQLNGVSGPVKFLVSAGTYTFTSALKINLVNGASPLNTVTFDGGSAATTTLTGSIAYSPIVMLNNCYYITLRNFTITNSVTLSATGPTTCSAITILGSSLLNYGSGCNIKNCIINLPNTASYSSAGIAMTVDTSGSSFNTSVLMDSVLIDSNIINGGYYGIGIFGALSTGYNRGLKIRSNTLNNNYYMGANLTYIFNSMDVNFNTLNLSASTSYYGLYLNRCEGNSTPHNIIGNKIYNSNGYGIYAANILSNPNYYIKIFDNIISSSTTNGYNCLYLVLISGYADVYHNTLIYNYPGASTTYGPMYYSSTSTAINIKNNILINTATTGTATCLYLGSNPTGNVVNNNVYYNKANTNLVYRNLITYTPSTYLSATAGGDSSFNVLPNFVSTSDFHLADGCNPKGTNVNSSIPYDIDGQTRSTTPLVGADEVPIYLNDMTVTTLLSPAFPLSLGTQTVAARVKNLGSNTVSFFNISYKLNSATPVTQIYATTPLNSCDTTSITFTTTATITLSNNTLKVYTSGPNSTTDGNTSNDTLTSVLSTPMSGAYVIGVAPSDFTTFALALASLQQRGVSGRVTLNVKSATYNEYIDFSTYTIPGLSTSNSVTFQSQAGVSDSVILSPSSNAFIIKYTNTSYVHFRNMTLTQPTVGNNGIVFTGTTSSFDTIYNCKINLPLSASTSYIVTTNGAYLNNIVLRKNTFSGGYYGIYMYNRTPNVGQNCFIDSNTFQNIYYYPLYIDFNSVGFKIKNNTFTLNSNSSGTVQEIYNYYPDSAYEFANNIMNIASGIATFWFYPNYYAQGNASIHTKLYNNKIILAATTTQVIGYIGYWTVYTDVYNNDFNLGNGYVYTGYGSTTRLYNNTINSNSASYTMYVYAGYPGNEKWNNIISNTGSAPALYTTGTLGATEKYDFNNYYTTGTNLIYSGAYYTMSSWKALAANVSAGRDRNSLNYRPPFTSTLNLAPNAADTAVWSINGRAIHGFAATDVNGVTRPATTSAGVPDIGAYEVTPSVLPPFATMTPTATPTAGISQYFTFGSDTVARIDWASFSTVPATITLRNYTGVPPTQTGTVTNYMYAYWDFVAPAGFYNYSVTLYYKKPWIGTNPNEANMILTKKVIGSPWTASYSSTIDTTRTWLSCAGLYNIGQTTGTDQFVPLPIKLTTFVAIVSANNGLLTWSTASEINSSMFGIERSLDRINFTPIANVKASGNSMETMNYLFTDYNALDLFKNTNTIYYRLKLVDKDGSYSYSDIAILNRKSISDGNINVYPNPFTNNISLSVGAAQNATATIEISDIQGRLIASRTIEMIKGDKQITLNGLSELEKGVYLINVYVNGDVMHTKVIKN